MAAASGPSGARTSLGSVGSLAGGASNPPPGAHTNVPSAPFVLICLPSMSCSSVKTAEAGASSLVNVAPASLLSHSASGTANASERDVDERLPLRTHDLECLAAVRAARQPLIAPHRQDRAVPRGHLGERKQRRGRTEEGPKWRVRLVARPALADEPELVAVTQDRDQVFGGELRPGFEASSP